MKPTAAEVKSQYRAMLNEYCKLITNEHIAELISIKGLTSCEFEINGYSWSEYFDMHQNEQIEFVRIENYSDNLEYIYFWYKDGIANSITFDVVDGEDVIYDGITIDDVKEEM